MQRDKISSLSSQSEVEVGVGAEAMAKELVVAGPKAGGEVKTQEMMRMM